jgi:hypothetical protein
MTFLRWPAVMIASAFVAAAPIAAHAACPIAATPTAAIEMPNGLLVGEFVDVIVKAAIGTATAMDACLDDTVAVTVQQADAATPSKFSVRIPPSTERPAGLLPVGTHTLTLQVTDGKGTTIVAQGRVDVTKPTLNEARLVKLTENNREFRVRLRGDHFDSAVPKNNRIVMDGIERVVCWPGETCPASSTVIHGMSAGATEIVLSNITPAEEAQATFSVCYHDTSSGLCSAAKTDDEASAAHTVVFLISLGVTLLVAIIVAATIVICSKGVKIANERYLLRALLLDRETDTYSLSKLQFYIWTVVAVFTYTYLTASRNLFQDLVGLPQIPPGLPGIISVAAGTSVGAQVVTQIRGPKGAGRLHPCLADLITTGDVVAAERVQFLVWTIVGAGGFAIVIANLDPRAIVDLPVVPSSLLQASGVSALGYLGGKLARDAGPVINEVIVRKGSDPNAVPAAADPQPTPAWAQSMSAAIAAIADVQKKFAAVVGPPSIQRVIAAARTAVDAATGAASDLAKLSASSASADITAARTAIDKRAADANKGAADAAAAVAALTTVSADDRNAATTLAALAQSAAKAVQDLQTALKAAATGDGQSGSSASSKGPFGLLDLRGRTLSQDATFKISPRADSDVDDFQLTFDWLEPSPEDDRHLQKPRVVELDPDARAATMAKRLLLVVRLDSRTEPFFQPGTTHTLTVTNPDSQKVVFKYDVPATQKAS